MRLLAWLAATALILGACSVGAPATARPATAAPAPLGSPGTPGPTAPPATTPAAAQLAAFMTITLTDVRSGERFTLADLKGKVTIVEGMAVW